jgi:hypothetical protein
MSEYWNELKENLFTVIFVFVLGGILYLLLLGFNALFPNGINDIKTRYSNVSKNANQIIEGKPHIELQNKKPGIYQITVKEFEYKIAYSLEAVGKRTVKGDFEKLDSKIYNALKGLRGNCEIFIIKTETDKYGNTATNKEYMCTIDVDELNKYKSAELWHNSVGFLRSYDNRTSDEPN